MPLPIPRAPPVTIAILLCSDILFICQWSFGSYLLVYEVLVLIL